MTTVKLRETIDLTDNERKIFDLLLGFLHESNLKTQLRVAGGWVRDKLLGKDSDDIDIAIDDMTGSEFLETFQDYFSNKVGEVVNIHIIKSNPKKFKHLETGKMRLFNQWIDFVQLRKEEADENSRYPKSAFGTPEEDAYRRDLTINRKLVEFIRDDDDDAMTGIDDLKSGRIITPLPAKTTFLEDPLRVLRAIRFGAKFCFTLDEELKEAASSEEVRVALERKICRERIGNEIDMMITGTGPVSAVTYLSDFKLFGVVFAIPSSSEPSPGTNCGSLCRDYMEAMWNLIQTHGLVNFSSEQRRLALYAALFLPFRRMVYKENKEKLVSVVNYILKNSMKRKFKDAETVISIHRAAERFKSLILPLQLKNPVHLDKLDWGSEILELCESISLNDPKVLATSKIRVLTGFLLRDIKDFWRVALLVSLLLYKDDDGMNLDLDKKIEIYLTIQDNIRELSLDNVWDIKPLMDGEEIIKEVQKEGLVTAKQDRGPIIREWQKKMLTWKLTYTKGSKEEWMSWMRQKLTRTCVTLEHGESL
ncbi:unnamed protein product [Eruca vesicaria subsp. sativa]|uniref:Poly A polymerase head domain-containing protein n=1 Tax=Eruca vesicaria subsp. sativa TaxID=29727 RepID=A0ABC8LKR5_ERUVS|nr:unnamed protein product [Eruca vesicaria subsp. sativa]